VRTKRGILLDHVGLEILLANVSKSLLSRVECLMSGKKY
jgi:hypothetical protein